MENKKPKFDGQAVLKSSIDWLTEYFSSQEIVYDYKTDSLKSHDEVLDHKVMMSSLRLAIFSAGENQYIKKLLPDVLTMWKHEQMHAVVEAYRNKFKYKKADLPGLEIKAWVKAATGKTDPLDVAVMTHFIWQVKRKLFKMPVEQHTMPILFGKSGGGKSVAVEKLLKPIEDLAMTTNMTVFEDRFGKRQFTRNYVMFFDELNGAGDTDVNKLKQVITSPVMEWRVMHSEGVASAPQNCTFIGCTNDPVSERIKDPTSARRFWQLDCQDKLDWNALNQIDYQELWNSVDEDSECPLLPFVAEIRKIQDTVVRAKDLIEQWVDDQVVDGLGINESSLTTKNLYDKFAKWCEWQGISSHPRFTSFGKKLPEKLKLCGKDPAFAHSKRGSVWAIRVKE